MSKCYSCRHDPSYLDDLCVRRRERAYRPVRTEDEPIRSQDVEGVVDIGGQIVRAPDLPVGLGDESAELPGRIRQVAPGAQPFTFGGQRILLMLVNFQDAPTQPYTPASAHDLVFGSTSAFFIENS